MSNLERHDRRDMLDETGDREEHIPGVAILLHRAVHLPSRQYGLPSASDVKQNFTFKVRPRLAASATDSLGI